MLTLTQTPTFDILSLSFGFALGDIGKIQVSANNLTDEHNVQVMSLLRELNINQAVRDFSINFLVNF